MAYQWGRRDYKTAKKLLDKVQGLGITYNWFATDWWDSFLKALKGENHKAGKEFTGGIEGNNCRPALAENSAGKFILQAPNLAAGTYRLRMVTQWRVAVRS